MFIVTEEVNYVDGTNATQLCGTYNTYEDAHRLLYTLYHDELASDSEYDDDWCEIQDDFAIVGGEGGFPRVMKWFLFDSDNPKTIDW